MKTIFGALTLQQNRYPECLLKQLKAHFCAQGNEPIDCIDYFETYSPIVL